MDWETWRALHSEHSALTDNILNYYYSIATTLLLDPDFIKDTDTAELLYGLLVCHLATVAARGSTGQIASATEGSVSASFSIPTSSDGLDAWLMSTPCGALYLAYIRQYRRGGLYRACPHRHIG